MRKVNYSPRKCNRCKRVYKPTASAQLYCTKECRYKYHIETGSGNHRVYNYESIINIDYLMLDTRLFVINKIEETLCIKGHLVV